MADTGIQTIEGNDEFLFDDYHLVSYIVFWIDTPTIEIDELSTVLPRRQMHAGWISLCSGTAGVAAVDLTVAEIATTWFSYFDFQNNLKVNPSNFAFDDRVQFNLPIGVVGKFLAAW